MSVGKLLLVLEKTVVSSKMNDFVPMEIFQKGPASVQNFACSYSATFLVFGPLGAVLCRDMNK